MPALPEIATRFIQVFTLTTILGIVVLVLATWAGRVTTNFYDWLMAG